jgi:hypothetical protein
MSVALEPDRIARLEGRLVPLAQAFRVDVAHPVHGERFPGSVSVPR